MRVTASCFLCFPFKPVLAPRIVSDPRYLQAYLSPDSLLPIPRFSVLISSLDDNGDTNYSIHMDRKSPSRQALVVKANALLPFLAKLSLNELRLLAFCISTVDRDSDSFTPITAKATSLADVFSVDSDLIYGLIKELSIKINSKPLEILEGNSRIIRFWFTEIAYNQTEGTFTFEFSDKLRPYLLQLRSNFTSYRIRDVYQFTSASTWHVYELLRQHKNMSKFEIDIDRFKAFIGVAASYSKFGNFKYKVVDPSIDEINKVSDIKVQYEVIKRGVKAVGFRFHIRDNDGKHTLIDRAKRHLLRNTPNALPEFAKLLRDDYSVSSTNAKRLANLVAGTKTENKVRDALPRIRQRWEGLEGKRRPLGAYVFGAIRDEVSQEMLVRLDNS